MKKQANPDDKIPDSFIDLNLFRLEQHLQNRLREFEALSPEDQETARPIAEAERTLLKKVEDVFSEAGRDEVDLHNHIDAVWEHYLFTGHPDALANYLELGGDIDDDDVRMAIIKRLREGPPKNKGSRDNIRDVDTYMAIEDIRFQRSIEIMALIEAGKKYQSVEGTEQATIPKSLNQIEARTIFIKQIGRAIPDDTVRKRYERGRYLVTRKKGK